MTGKPTLGDAPIQSRYRERMNVLVRFLDEQFNGEAPSPADEAAYRAWMKAREVGFVLLVFNFNQPEGVDPRCNFISNGADRKDLVVLFKEMIARFEGQPDMKGQA